MTALAVRSTAPPSGHQAAPLPGDRLHLNEGPIDLVIGADGPPAAVREAYRRAEAAFAGLLGGLVSELAALRLPIAEVPPDLSGPVARRMVAAVWPLRARNVTPMAAVAGAVADEICAAMQTVEGLRKAFVNDGGDIAVFLDAEESMSIGLVTHLQKASPSGSVTITPEMPIRGIATSGAGGRSLSLGIADAVTVLAPSAAAADAAATLIANAVDSDHPVIERAPAISIDPDSDLGDRLVTVARGPLPTATIEAALDAGTAVARQMMSDGLISAALLACDGKTRIVQPRHLKFHDIEPLQHKTVSKAPRTGVRQGGI